MQLESLTLKNFRNYASEKFNYGAGVNVITGGNAQGKTNSAEAVFLLATGFSPRVKKDKQVIRYGESQAEISGQAISAYGSVKTSLTFFADGKKKISVNEAEVKRVGDLLGNIYAVFFNPGELKLIQESPEDRRRFMDIALSQLNRRYFYSLSKYKKIIIQRNNLLKESDKELILDTLPVWDEQLADYAADVIEGRNEFCSKLAPKAKAAHEAVTGGEESLFVGANEKFKGSREEIKEKFKAALAENTERDMVLGFTSVGPHRDDLKITLNGEDVKSYGSQGQQRTAALSLKLAELEIFKEKFGEYPLLILDDALSELDRSRQKRLLKYIENVQTIITCTHIEEEVFVGTEYKRFEVEKGKIVKES